MAYKKVEFFSLKLNFFIKGRNKKKGSQANLTPLFLEKLNFFIKIRSHSEHQI